MIAHWPMIWKVLVMVALVALGGWLGGLLERWLDRRKR